MKNIAGVFLCLLVLFFTGFALAQNAEDSEEIVARRQALFKLIAYSNRVVAQMTRSKPFDLEAALQGAERVAVLSEMIPELFVEDTRAASGLTTRASSLIWENPGDFNDVAVGLTAGANSAIDILKNQGEAGLREAVRSISQHCSACHQRYRLDRN